MEMIQQALAFTQLGLSTLCHEEDTFHETMAMQDRLHALGKVPLTAKALARRREMSAEFAVRATLQDLTVQMLNCPEFGMVVHPGYIASFAELLVELATARKEHDALVGVK